MEYLRFSFELTASDDSAELGFETWINDQQLFNTDHVQGSNLVSGYLPADDCVSTHTLKLVLKGKTPQHTTVNAQGEIVKDATVCVSNLKFDNIPLNYLADKLCVYHHNFNKTNNNFIEDTFCGIMGCNGTVELKFTTPIYLWMLKNT
jgi:hypothetical protein